MNVERQLGVLAHSRHHRRAEGNVIDEMAVHDVEMQPVRACTFDAVDLVFEMGEIRGQDGWSDEN